MSINLTQSWIQFFPLTRLGFEPYLWGGKKCIMIIVNSSWSVTRMNLEQVSSWSTGGGSFEIFWYRQDCVRKNMHDIVPQIPKASTRTDTWQVWYKAKKPTGETPTVHMCMAMIDEGVIQETELPPRVTFKKPFLLPAASSRASPAVEEPKHMKTTGVLWSYPWSLTNDWACTYWYIRSSSYICLKRLHELRLCSTTKLYLYLRWLPFEKY